MQTRVGPIISVVAFVTSRTHPRARVHTKCPLLFVRARWGEGGAACRRNRNTRICARVIEYDGRPKKVDKLYEIRVDRVARTRNTRGIMRARLIRGARRTGRTDRCPSDPR